MWIITKTGIFNLDAIACVKDYPGETVAMCNGVKVSVTNHEICDQIAIALKNGDNILEVE